MSKIRNWGWTAALSALLVGVVTAEEHGFVDRVYRDDKGEHRYVVFVPKQYTPDRSWPVILFLHSAGERGTDGQAHMKVGLGPAVQAREETFPFIAVLPQCEDRDAPARRGWLPETDDGRRALEILGEVQKEYRTDKDRVYLTGISMGGFGAWAHAAADPARWAAVVPICGGGETEWATKLARLPIWCFHGGADRVVPPEESRRMIQALKQAGGMPRYTELSGVGHNSWDPAYGKDALFDWLLAQRRGQRVSTLESMFGPGRGDSKGAIEAVLPEAPFVTALEIPQAVFVRLGNEMLAALADSLPTVIPTDALSGTLADIQTTTSAEGRSISVQFRGLSYRGRISRATLEAKEGNQISVVIAMRDVNLLINRTDLWGNGVSASCGPLRIVLGHRADLPLAFQVRPVIEDRRIRFKLIATQFRIGPNDWTVGYPSWVNASGAFVTEDRVSSGLRNGIYSDPRRIEREVVGAVPQMLKRLEEQFSLEPMDEIVAGLWPLPVYRPRLRTWASRIAADATGLTVALGVSVAAFDPASAPAHPKVIDLAGSDAAMEVASEHFQFGVATNLVEPLSTQVISDDAARAHVSDMPMQKLQPLGNAKALGEFVPDLKQRGEREVRAELRLMSPLRLTRGNGGSGEAIVFELTKVRCAIAVHPTAGSSDWVPYLDIDFSLRQAARPSISLPTTNTRALTLAWQGTADIEVQAHFAPGYSPKDSGIDTNAIRNTLAAAWQEWTETGSLAQVAMPDLDLGFSKLRAQAVGWDGAYLATTFGPSGLQFRNVSEQPVAYEMKGPYSNWGGPYTLEPRQDHRYEISYPVTCRFQSGKQQKEYTLAPGLRFEFRADDAGNPELYTSPDEPDVSNGRREQATSIGLRIVAEPGILQQ